MTHSVRLDLAQGAPRDEQRPPVAMIEIDYDGSIYWNERFISLAEVAQSTRSLLVQFDKAESRVRAARLVRYEHVAKFLAQAERNGARRISFLGNERFL
jgi:biopolymer transport protein ExbD